MVRGVIGHHTLTDRDVRTEFQRCYGSSPYIWVDKRTDRLHDNICFTEEGLRMGKSPILLSQSVNRSLGKYMLELQKKYHEAKMERDKELYERQIKVVER